MPAIDISVFGDKELEKKLSKLVDRTQKKVVRQALRKETKKAKARVVSNITRLGLVDEGVMLAAFEGTKIKSSSKKDFIRIGFENPTRQALNIAAADPYYYPYAVEFGHDNVPARPFIRPAIDEHKSTSLIEVGKDIGFGIEREAKK